MPSFGAIRRELERQAGSTSAADADACADRWIALLEEFERQTPSGRFQQVQWLRALAKLVAKMGASDAPEAGDLAELCRRAMIALHQNSPEAGHFVRLVGSAAPILAPRLLSARFIAARLSQSLGPTACFLGQADGKALLAAGAGRPS
jgi:hypothetical protein